jgi:hypothetical protein
VPKSTDSRHVQPPPGGLAPIATRSVAGNDARRSKRTHPCTRWRFRYSGQREAHARPRERHGKGSVASACSKCEAALWRGVCVRVLPTQEAVPKPRDGAHEEATLQAGLEIHGARRR